MNLDVFAIGIVAETLFLLIVLILIWYRVAFDERTEVSVCRKVGDAASDIAKEHIPAPVISCYANREPHVQVRLLVRCSKNGFAFRG